MGAWTGLSSDGDAGLGYKISDNMFNHRLMIKKKTDN